MSPEALALVMWHLAIHAPILLVYVGTLVVAVVYMGRFPAPSSLALAGAAILLLTSLTFPVVQWLIVCQRWANQQAILDYSAFTSNCILALATSLLVCAVFVGRRPASVAPSPAGP